MKKAKSARAKTAIAAETPANLVDNTATVAGQTDQDAPPPPPPQVSASTGHTGGNKALFDDDIPEDALPPPRPNPILSLQLSAALHSKLRFQAQDEGISVEALALEMLAESVVLRAWEIVERKNAMRGGATGFGPSHASNSNHRSSHGQGPQAHGNSKHHRPGYNNHGHQNNQGGSGRHNSYNQPHGRQQNNAWMEDKAAFLEYVRNQEKRGRR